MNRRDRITAVLMGATPEAAPVMAPRFEDRRNDVFPPVEVLGLTKPPPVPLGEIPPPNPMSRGLGSDELDGMEKSQYLDTIFGKRK